MITAKNFCRIEVQDEVQILFYTEYDGDDVILHQVVNASVGTIDMKVKLPAETWEERWPEKVTFEDAAKKVISVVKEMGFSFDLEEDAT